MIEVGAPPPTTALGAAGAAEGPTDPVQTAVDAAKATLAEHATGSQIAADLTQQIPGLLANLDLDQADKVLHGIAAAVPPELRVQLERQLDSDAQALTSIGELTGQAAQSLSGDHSTQMQSDASHELMAAAHLESLRDILILQGQ